MMRKKVSALRQVCVLLLVCCGASVWADREYFNARWKTLKYETKWPNRRNSPISYSSRCACSREGTLVLDKKEIVNILIKDGEETRVIGPTNTRGSTNLNNSVIVDMQFYTSVVILNRDDYTIYGEDRQVSRVDPWGLWVIE
jgi:hypothetical protein